MKVFMPTHEGTIIQNVTAGVVVRNSSFCLAKEINGMKNFIKRGDFKIYRVCSTSPARLGFSDAQLDDANASWQDYYVPASGESFIALPNSIKAIAMFTNVAALVLNIQRGVFVDA